MTHLGAARPGGPATNVQEDEMNLRRRSAETVTVARYDITDDIVREFTDETPLADQPTPPRLNMTNTFRPDIVQVTVCWATGKTSVELTGPRYGGVGGQGVATFEFADWMGAENTGVALIRDAVGQAALDHDKRNI